jgi:hypothetical protein
MQNVLVFCHLSVPSDISLLCRLLGTCCYSSIILLCDHVLLCYDKTPQMWLFSFQNWFRLTFWRQEMKEKVFKSLYVQKFHGPVLVLQGLCRFSALIFAHPLETGLFLYILNAFTSGYHHLYIYFGWLQQCRNRLLVGQSITLRRVVPLLGVPDALVPIDPSSPQINLLPGYCSVL